MKLQAEKREHLATLLSQEAFKVKQVSNELRNSTPNPVRLAILEEELIQLEFRVNKEVIKYLIYARVQFLRKMFCLDKYLATGGIDAGISVIQRTNT